METKLGFRLLVAPVLVMASAIPASFSSNLFAQGPVTINGAGASFPFPLIDTWRVEYQTVDPNTNINYQSIGSGGGVQQFTEKTVDFGATDAPLTPEEATNAPGAVTYPRNRRLSSSCIQPTRSARQGVKVNWSNFS